MQRESPRPRVLLGDDDKGILAALQRLLALSYEVVGSAPAGGALLDAAVRLRPDVVVLDLNLPEISGLEACRQIKAIAPQTKVILLTAADDLAIRRRALSLGASAFVLKYRADDLIPAIERALEENSASSA